MREAEMRPGAAPAQGGATQPKAGLLRSGQDLPALDLFQRLEQAAVRERIAARKRLPASRALEAARWTPAEREHRNHWRISLHEAAHALRSLGIADAAVYTRVTATPTHGWCGGEVPVDRTYNALTVRKLADLCLRAGADRRQLLLDELEVFIAGPAADAITDGRQCWDGSDDREMLVCAELLYGASNASRATAIHFARVRRILARPAIQAGLAAVARRLMYSTWLDGGTVREILRPFAARYFGRWPAEPVHELLAA